MQQSQLKAAVTLIKVTSTPPQEDAVNPGKGAFIQVELQKQKTKNKTKQNKTPK